MPWGTWPVAGDYSTLGEIFDAVADQFGHIEAYVDGVDRLTFAEWRRAADAVAQHFASLGVRPGDVVGISLPPSIAYAIVTMAVIRLGAIATGLNTRLGAREVEAISSLCAPRLVVHEHEQPPAGLAQGVTTLDVDVIEAIWHAEDVVLAPAHVAKPTDPVVIIWTSGTTGVPKGAWFDHQNLASIARAAGVISAPFDRKLSATPFAHAGYMGKLWDQLMWVNTMVLCPTPWSALDMVRLARSEHITVAGGAPVQWEKFLDILESDGGPRPSLRVGVVATAPAPPPLIERVRNTLGCTLVVRYAMTESPSIAGTEDDDADLVKARTVGRAQEGMQIRVLDDMEMPCPSGIVGNVQVAGGCVMRGYYGAEELTRSAFTDDGWLRTNDTGFFDAEGNLVLVGRRSEMYIRGGYNVYPLEVENVLLEHSEVAEVAVLGHRADTIGEIGICFVTPAHPEAPPTHEALTSWVRQHLADYKVPDEIRFVTALPRTRMMKIDKEQLKELLVAQPPVRRTQPKEHTDG